MVTAMNDENLVETQYFQPGENHPAAVHADGDLTEFKPWSTIWTSPRKTIRQILNTDPNFCLVPLICLNGIAAFLENAADDSAGDQLSLRVILLLALVLGPLLGVVSVWIASHLIRISGDWLGGVADYAQIKPAVAWGSVPSVATLLLWIPLIGILGKDAFTNSMEVFEGETFQAAIVLGLGVLFMILGIWSIVLMSNTVAEVQEYRSAWKGLGNILLAGLLIALPIIAVVAIFAGLLTAFA